MGRVVVLTLWAMAFGPLLAYPQASRSSGTKQGSVAHKTAAKTTVALRPSAHSSAHVAGAARSLRSGASTIRTRSGRVIRVAKAPPAPSYQLHPDPDRYQTIQRALTDRGYFKGDPNGEWGDDSVDAMRRFQADQKIDNDGKIDALSLIALGLGPRHDGTAASEPHVAPAPAPSTPASITSSTASTSTPPVPLVKNP